MRRGLRLRVAALVGEHGHARVADDGGLRHAVEAAAAGALFPELGEDFGEAVVEVVGLDFGLAHGVDGLEDEAAAVGEGAFGEFADEVGV